MSLLPYQPRMARFPDADKLKSDLFNSYPFNSDFCIGGEITKTVIELAAQTLGGQLKARSLISLDVTFMISELQSKAKRHPYLWIGVASDLEKALSNILKKAEGKPTSVFQEGYTS